MKVRSIFPIVALAVASVLTTTPAKAQSIDPCTLYMCMAGISGFGTTGGPGCIDALIFWHAAAPAGLAVYTPVGFIPPASYAAREAYLTVGCPAANTMTNPVILQAIMAEWGSEP